MGGLHGGAAVDMAGSQPFPRRRVLLGMEQFCAESARVLHEAVLGAGVEGIVIIFGISLSKVDHYVFVQMSLAPQVTAEEVKGQGEQVLGVLTGAALALATGTITHGVDTIGKKEDDFPRGFLLSGEPLHQTHLGYFLSLPLVKDNLASAVVLKKFSEVTNRVMETYLGWVNHKNLHGGQ